MNRYFINFFLLSAIFFSCKKRDQPVSGSSGGSAIASITPSTASNWYALFDVGKFIEIGGLTPGVYNTTQVSFFKTPQPFPGQDAMMVDSVFLNETPLDFWSFQDSSYVDTSGLMQGLYHTITYPYTFRVRGRWPIPSFTYTRNGPFPSYTGYSALPDTIYRAGGFTLDLQTMSAADEINVNIHSFTNSASKTVYPPFSTKLTFSAPELLLLDTTSNSSIEIILIKADNLAINGKPMLFADGLNVTKHIVLR